MSAFNDWYKKPLPGYDDSINYYNKDDLEQAFNAGMERAAELMGNQGQSRQAEAIRKEIK